MAQRIDASDLKLHKKTDTHIYLMVTNPHKRHAWWPMLVSYQGDYWEWNGNQPQPTELPANSVFGYGAYRKIVGVTIEADESQLMTLRDQETDNAA